ncbi:MAG: sugar phosphate nucleotidyltransferase [Gaiella sp.]|nr:sugar phosphate nucleotidyltransferase [Gaiella sp.]
MEHDDRDSVLAAGLARAVEHDERANLAARTRVVVLAGGRGRRLEPYTSVLPKPLMPIGNRAILEILVQQLTEAGFLEVTLCVGYLSHLIRAVFDNGHDRGLRVTYVKEDEPLGTAAPLRLVPDLDSTFVAMNGDLLTTIDYGQFLAHHHASDNVLTIATHRRRLVSDYGVLRFDDASEPLRVSAYQEKPEMHLDVSMGIYAIEPGALEFVPEGEPSDFPDLVHALLDAGKRVGAYPFEGLWLDIGRHEDYVRAIELWESGTPNES